MTNTDIANRLSDIRNTIKTLKDEQALDYISHAIDTYHRRNTKATEVWLQMAIVRMAEIRKGARKR